MNYGISIQEKVEEVGSDEEGPIQVEDRCKRVNLKPEYFKWVRLEERGWRQKYEVLPSHRECKKKS